MECQKSHSYLSIEERNQRLNLYKEAVVGSRCREPLAVHHRSLLLFGIFSTFFPKPSPTIKSSLHKHAKWVYHSMKPNQWRMLFSIIICLFIIVNPIVHYYSTHLISNLSLYGKVGLHEVKKQHGRTYILNQKDGSVDFPIAKNLVTLVCSARGLTYVIQTHRVQTSIGPF